MKTQLRLEEIGMFILGVVLFASLEFPWWLFAALILVPDVSMIGYVINNRIGAVVYNVAHHKAVAVVVYTAGALLHNPILMLAGIILFSHASMDRIFGYGLKYPDSFKHTHLGWIGNNTNSK